MGSALDTNAGEEVEQVTHIDCHTHMLRDRIHTCEKPQVHDGGFSQPRRRLGFRNDHACG